MSAESGCPTCVNAEGYDRLSGPCPTCHGEDAITPCVYPECLTWPDCVCDSPIGEQSAEIDALSTADIVRLGDAILTDDAGVAIGFDHTVVARLIARALTDAADAVERECTHTSQPCFCGSAGWLRARAAQVTSPARTEADRDCLTLAEKALRERLSAEDWMIVKAGFRRSAAAAVGEAKADIKARITTFRALDAHPEYMNALNDAWGVVANRERTYSSGVPE